MDKDDLISRKAALDAIDGMKPMQGNMEQLAMKALCWAAVKTIQPVDAIPLDWLREKMRGYASALKSTELSAVVTVMSMWEREQEVR